MTAVDFLFKEMNKIRVDSESNILSAPELFERQNSVYKIAKELEREQHGKTWDKAIDNFEKRAFVKVRAICDFDEYKII